MDKKEFFERPSIIKIIGESQIVVVSIIVFLLSCYPLYLMIVQPGIYLIPSIAFTILMMIFIIFLIIRQVKTSFMYYDAKKVVVYDIGKINESFEVPLNKIIQVRHDRRRLYIVSEEKVYSVLFLKSPKLTKENLELLQGFYQQP